MPLARPRLALVASLLWTACPGTGTSTSDDSQTETAPQTTTEAASTTQDCQIGSEGCSCTGGNGCDLGLTCNLETKICESGASTSTTTSTSDPPAETSTGGTDEGESSSDTGETLGPACVATGDGKESPACMALDPTRPFCIDDTCVACTGLEPDACALGTLEQRPLCLDSGACGQCDEVLAVEAGQCTAEMPHCNLDTNMCEGCFEHSECPGTACKIAERECFPPENVLYVRQGSKSMPCVDEPGNGGGLNNPYCDFEVATIAAQLGGFNDDFTFISLANDEALGKGQSAVNISSGPGKPSYAFVHELGDTFNKHAQFVGIGPMITVPKDVTLYINNFGVVIEGGVGDSSLGIACNDGSVWIDDSRVIQGRGPNIRSANCDLHLRRTAVAFGSTEGIEMNGGSLHAVSSFISSNTSKPGLGGGGLRLSGGATIDVLYSTIADNSNEASKGLGDSIQCDDPATIKMRNSILARRPTGGNASIVCPGSNLNITWSAVDSNLGLGEGNNNNKLAAESMLMGLVLDNNTGVFRVLKGDRSMYFSGTAQWKTGDPHFDFEGHPRNTVDGSPDYAGGDVLDN